MLTVDLRALLGKMNETCRRSLDAAAGLAVARKHYNVEIEHWLLKLLDAGDSDFARIIRHYEVDQGRLSADLNRKLDWLKTSNASGTGLSHQMVALARESWLFASLDGAAARLRSGHIMVALLNDDALAPFARNASAQLDRISPEGLRRNLLAITEGSAEAATATAISE